MGTDDWTTLPDASGGTSTDVPDGVRGGLLRGRASAARCTTSRSANPCTARRARRASGTRSRVRPTAGSRWRSTSARTRAAGRGGRQLRHRPGHRRRGPHRRRHQARRRRATSPRPRASRRASAPGRCSGAPDGEPGQRERLRARRRPRRQSSAVTATPDTLLFGFGLEQLDVGCRARGRGGEDPRALRRVVDATDAASRGRPRRGIRLPAASSHTEPRPVQRPVAIAQVRDAALPRRGP